MMLTMTDGIIFAIALGLMVLDIASGVIAAVVSSSWQSSVMRKGLLHKCSEILCLALGAILQYGQQLIDLGISVPAFKAICAYVMLMEIGSFLENVCRANPRLGSERIRQLLGLTSLETQNLQETQETQENQKNQDGKDA